MSAGPQPFFLAADPGQRFCLLYKPLDGIARRGCVVYVHPFAEELNKTRRMAALQARALSEQGFAVLQMDLYGCGDSSGDFGDARWQDWHSDLAQACRHALAQAPRPLILWGLRLGALLTLDYAASARHVDALLLWQPVLSGDTHLRQFFRLQSTARLLAPDLNQAGANGDNIEVGGYALSHELQRDIRAVDAQSLSAICPVFWVEQPGPSSSDLPPASANLIQHWSQSSVRIQTALAPGPQIWATSEITECPSFLAATQNFLTQDLSA